MPLIHISLLEGRSAEMKHRVIHDVAHACADALEVPVDRIHVALHEMSFDEYGAGGVPAAIRRANASTE
jgi:4-oxalocrotonate tautomerase family enzyme